MKWFSQECCAAQIGEGTTSTVWDDIEPNNQHADCGLHRINVLITDFFTRHTLQCKLLVSHDDKLIQVDV